MQVLFKKAPEKSEASPRSDMAMLKNQRALQPVGRFSYLVIQIHQCTFEHNNFLIPKLTFKRSICKLFYIKLQD